MRGPPERFGAAGSPSEGTAASTNKRYSIEWTRSVIYWPTLVLHKNTQKKLFYGVSSLLGPGERFRSSLRFFAS